MCFFLNWSSQISAPKRKWPIPAAVSVRPCDWLLGNFLFGTEIGEGQLKKHPVLCGLASISPAIEIQRSTVHHVLTVYHLVSAFDLNLRYISVNLPPGLIWTLLEDLVDLGCSKVGNAMSLCAEELYEESEQL